jgi:hypothetical protein
MILQHRPTMSHRDSPSEGCSRPDASPRWWVAVTLGLHRSPAVPTRAPSASRGNGKDKADRPPCGTPGAYRGASPPASRPRACSTHGSATLTTGPASVVARESCNLLAGDTATREPSGGTLRSPVARRFVSGLKEAHRGVLVDFDSRTKTDSRTAKFGRSNQNLSCRLYPDAHVRHDVTLMPKGTPSR